jgi:hypothetical protein
MSRTERREVRWDTAQIEDAALTVELSGASSKAWKARFERVLALLDSAHSSWGRIRVSKDRIKVDDVQLGSESDLRHFLESLVLQANAESQVAGRAPDSIDAREEPGPDERMTRTFRSFAAEP